MHCRTPGGLDRDAIAPWRAKLRQESVLPIRAYADEMVSIVATTEPEGRSSIVEAIGRGAVGVARLDVEELPAGASAQGSDLERAMHTLHAAGGNPLPLCGDFAFVAWDCVTRTLLAVRDPFGVKTLFYRQEGDTIIIASHAALLDRGSYDLEYIAEFLLSGGENEGRTIYAGVSAIRPGELLVIRPDRVDQTRYWSPATFEPLDELSASDACDRFRALFVDAVRMRARGTKIWAQLSGGLDSSSVVSVAETLAATEQSIDRLAGTVTILDHMGSGDESDFVSEVIRSFGIANQRVTDYWPWRGHDSGEAPVASDEPYMSFPFFARDRAIVDTVRRGGGRVLLSGLGADHYLTGNLYFVSDLVARGHWWQAATELRDWCVTTHSSFWTGVKTYAWLPNAPRHYARRQMFRSHDVPQWYNQSFVGRYAIRERLPRIRLLASPRGRRFASDVAWQVASVHTAIDRAEFSERIEMRYPFLYRPLVEFGLTLPFHMRARALQRKWILRQALRGVLPEKVRTRTGKGTIGARIRWALRNEKERIATMTREPILAELGCIEPRALRAVVRLLQQGENIPTPRLFTTLSLETWLRVRSGQWKVAPQDPARDSEAMREYSIPPSL